MKLTKDDIPKSIFLYLPWENILFCFSETDIVSIFLYDTVPVPFSDPISEIVSDHCTNSCQCDRENHMGFSPKSSYQDHDVHARYSGSNDGKRLDTCWRKCDEIVPVPKSRDKSAYPDNSQFYPIGPYEWDDHQDYWENREEYSDDLRDQDTDVFDYLHSSIVWKKHTFAMKIQLSSHK